jgi:hypothetical protein
VLTLVESTLENPDLVLRKQLDAAKTIKMAEMKAEGIEFDQRIEELEKMEYPKPRREFIYDTFNVFREAHPWIGQENIRPKSIAREMYENYYSFADYIREYDLQRIEGVLLRYLSETYKVLEQTVPEEAKDEELRQMALYFGNMVRGVDSSLLEDWEKMRRGVDAILAPESAPLAAPERPRARSNAELQRWLRNELARFLRALANRDYETALSLLRPNAEKTWTAPELEAHPKARNPQFIQVEKSGPVWRVEQTLIDPEDLNDWVAVFQAEFPEEEGAPVLGLESIGPIG